MSAGYFTQAAVAFIASVAVFTIFLNFLTLLGEELRKCSIMNKKKKSYAVLRRDSGVLIQNRV